MMDFDFRRPHGLGGICSIREREEESSTIFVCKALWEHCITEASKLPHVPHVYLRVHRDTLAWCGERIRRNESRRMVRQYSVLEHGFHNARQLAMLWVEDIDDGMSKGKEYCSEIGDKEGRTISENARRLSKRQRPSDYPTSVNETTSIAHNYEALATLQGEEDGAVPLLKQTLKVMVDDLLDICAPRTRSTITATQREKYYRPLCEHARVIRETTNISVLLDYMRLYFDRYMMEKIVPSEDPSYARVFVLLNALAACPPSSKASDDCLDSTRLIGYGSEISNGADLMDDLMSDKSAFGGTNEARCRDACKKYNRPRKRKRS